jgi:hypothetical protein
MIGAAMTTRKIAKQATPIDPAMRLMRAVRKAEIVAEEKIHDRIRKGDIVRDENDRGAPIDPGTGQTVLKLRQKAIPKLVNQGKLGPEELLAAAEILIAFSAIASRLMCRGINYDRVDFGGGGSGLDWPAKIARPVANYQAFAKAWTRRNEDYGDPTLQIVIDAVIDEMHLSAIPRKRGYGEARIERALIGGLRDYAARAGFVTGHKAIQWQAEAEAVFGPAEPELSRAIRRAAMERQP